MGSMFVVIPSPRLAHQFRVVETQKLMHVQALIAQAAVERFDVPIVGGLAWPRKVEGDAANERLGIHRP